MSKLEAIVFALANIGQKFIELKQQRDPVWQAEKHAAEIKELLLAHMHEKDMWQEAKLKDLEEARRRDRDSWIDEMSVLWRFNRDQTTDASTGSAQ
jgi:hypothetical protein